MIESDMKTAHDKRAALFTVAIAGQCCFLGQVLIQSAHSTRSQENHGQLLALLILQWGEYWGALVLNGGRQRSRNVVSLEHGSTPKRLGI